MFKHDKKGLNESLNQSDLLRTLRGIYGQNLMLSALMGGAQARTVLDNMSAKCHSINYRMIEDGMAVDGAVQPQTEGNNG